MYQLVVGDRYSNKSYCKLSARPHDTEFIYTIPVDDSQTEDGINFRYRFGREQLCSDVIVTSCLDGRPCNILEMTIALPIRCEEHIMDDPDAGGRTRQWFWNMLVSLGLGGVEDWKLDRYPADATLEWPLDRGYERNGEDGPLTVNNGRGT